MSDWKKELREIRHRAADVWGLIPRSHKLALAGAAVLMALTSAGNTGVALLLGRLVDSIHNGIDNGWRREQMYWGSGVVLVSISLIYVVREAMHVWRRYLVQDSCS